MGYDISVTCNLDISADKVPAAGRALWDAAIAKKRISEEVPPYSTAKDLADAINENFSEYIFSVRPQKDGAVCISSYEDHGRCEDEDQWIFAALGPYINGTVHFQGEDGCQWRWEFSEDGLEEVHSEVIFGDDIKAPGILKQIIKLIYHDGKPIISYGSDAVSTLDAIENLIREGGLGPQAGKSELERMAEV